MMKTATILKSIFLLSTLAAPYSADANAPQPKFTGLGISRFSGVNAKTTEQAMRTFTTKWALVIGIDNFENSDSHEDSPYHWHNKYAQKDARAVLQYLERKAHFPKDHCQILLDRNATKTNIENGFNWLSAQAKADDLALLYFRTKGIDTRLAGDESKSQGATSSPLPSTNFYSNFLAAEDTDHNNLAETAFDMREFLCGRITKLRAKGIVIVIDADFSQNAASTLFPTGRGCELQSGQTLNLITSTGPSELAWESNEFKSSVFTVLLLKNLKRHPSAPLISVAAELTDNLPPIVDRIRVGRTQTPWNMGLSQFAPSSIIISDPLLTKP